MVTIKSYKSYKREDGTEFFALVVQGGLETKISKETNLPYFTAKAATISCTFDEETCKELVGTKLDGEIKKVEVEPYSYIDENTGEEVIRSHRYSFFSGELEKESIIEENVEEQENVL